MNHIGLFEGIGGFSLAARWMGWKTIAWCEWNEFGQKVLNYHFPKAKGHGDITKTDFTIYRGQCDILTGGFPCQPYSQAGKRKGKEDDRHLWPEMLRAIKEIQPSWVVGENVFGLVNWSGGLVFHEVQTDLEAEGYEVFPYVLPACAVNAPHRRDRIWFVAHSSNAGVKRVSRRKDEAIQGTSTNTSSTRRNGDKELKKGCNDKRNGISFDESNSFYGTGIFTNTSSQGLEGANSRQQGARNSSRFHFETWFNFPTESPICSRDDGLPTELDGITFSKWRTESIKAYGNAIVPQVALQIFKAIQQYENDNK